MLARKARRFLIPAKCAPDSTDLVRRHRFAIAGAAEDNPPVALAGRHRFRRRANELWVINRLLACGAEILNLVSQRKEELLDLFLVAEAGVIGAQRDFHSVLLKKRCRLVEQPQMRRL